jgi:hypothetical protein
MSDPRDEEESGVESVPAEDDGELRNLLRGAFREDDAADAPQSDVLRGVQERIRKRSGGKFYADGWSTAKHPPTYTYLVTSVIMLVIAVVVYIVLAPTAGEPAPVKNEPAPVHIVLPRPPASR